MTVEITYTGPARGEIHINKDTGHLELREIISKEETVTHTINYFGAIDELKNWSVRQK